MRSRIITPPASEPITLDEAKEYLRVTHGHEDATITRQIRAARVACEHQARMSFVTQTWETSYTIPKAVIRPLLMPSSISDPDGVLGGLRVMHKPAASVVSVSALCRGKAPTVVPDTEYVLDLGTQRIEWANRQNLCQGYLNGNDIVLAQYVTGYSVEDLNLIHPSIVEAIYIVLSNLYENKGLSSQVLPPTAIELLAPYWTSPTFDKTPTPEQPSYEIWSQGRWFDQSQ